MKSVRLLVIGGGIAYRALFVGTTPSMFIGTLLAGPLLQLLFFVYLGRQLGVADDTFYILGNAVLAVSNACVIGGTMAVANERRYGTLGVVLLSPRSRVLLWVGRSLPYIANGLFVTVFVLTCGALLLGLNIPLDAIPGLLLALLGAALSGSAFGLALGALGLRFRDVFIVSNVAAALLLLLTGANVPREELPGWMGVVGEVLPLTHAAGAARSFVAGNGTGASGGIRECAAEYAVGVGYLLIAVLLLRCFERGSRARATLDTM
ncbi:ABC transporter permease [Streptomyces triticiradicis]|uniref:ABC transporter permease n=2 Tax=Streptomyces triticiradicis TaxID=2651189 RepID=A0A7J5D3T8_9ACTN|nr:ABC transporter permease [Streptomyces triticiradicis]